MPRRSYDKVFLGGPVYWLCQASGWGGYAAIGIVSDALWDRWSADTLTGTLCIAGSGLVVSHGYRSALKLACWTERPLGKLPGLALLGTGAMAAAWLTITWAVARLSQGLSSEGLSGWMWAMITLYALLLSGGWNVMYFAYHAGRRLLTEQKQAQVDRWRLQAALSEAQFQGLKAQVHPHFLFNALNGLRALVDENPAKAREAVTRLSNLLRYSLQTTGDSSAVPLARELEIVDDYLGLEAIRLENRLQVRRTVDPAALGRLVPPLSVQSLVENAVKYGVSPFRQPQEITLGVRLDLLDHALVVEVGNGCAPESERPAQSDSSGIGLANLRERLSRLGGERASLRLSWTAADRVVVRMMLPAPASTPEFLSVTAVER